MNTKQLQLLGKIMRGNAKHFLTKTVSKHEMSKKNAKHDHNWSKGQRKDLQKHGKLLA